MKLAIVVALLCLSACATTRATTAQLPDAVAGQFSGFNAHDPDAVSRHVTSDFTFYLVSGDRTSVEVRGRDELRSGLTDYFKAYPTARSEALGQTPQGKYVAVRERVRWTDVKGDHVQEALSVYELDGGLIKAVWYFPAEK